MSVFYALFLAFFFSLPARADIAIAPTSMFLGGLIYVWPILIAVVLIETLILWRFWGRSQNYSLRRVCGQILVINVITTLLGMLVLLFSEVLLFYFLPLSSTYLPFVLFFGVTVIAEALLLKQYYFPTAENGLSASSHYRASLAINLPSYLLLANLILWGGIQQREASRPHYTKPEMHKLQTLVETYAVDWGGVYPPSIETLEYDAKNSSQPYWKDILDKNGEPALMNADEPARPFGIRYVPERDPETGALTLYWIYGYDRKGEYLQDKGQTFTLSNAW